ncbi:MAG: zinc-ribbon domain-containing protein [Thermoguttaceae bacterium]|nr:zinc-ribbon domain-containing protein [Thermoguttaceae bacterium]
MSNWFYYDASGNKQGPVNNSQLKALAQSGIITRETKLETDTGQSGKAGQVRGLFGAPEPNPFAAGPEPTQLPPTPMVSMAYCTNCGSPVQEQAVACMKCGASPTGHNNFCRRCGIRLNPEQVICIKCGASVALRSDNPPVNTPPNNYLPKTKAKKKKSILPLFLVPVVIFPISVICVNLFQKMQFQERNPYVDSSIIDVAWRHHNYFNTQVLVISVVIAVISFFITFAIIQTRRD